MYIIQNAFLNIMYHKKQFLRSVLGFCTPEPLKSESTSLALSQICSANSLTVMRGTLRHCWALQAWKRLSGPKQCRPPPSGLQCVNKNGNLFVIC